ncbi:hypothetical protein [Geofilum rhodophaeum]|uniref:hypothetical protein n=1 Tax=Geofilum rhodophaeum TaxID=1965019 RepID=UPI000B525116|nr:hypothetical protein [Geofilum rhodophaeum]
MEKEAPSVGRKCFVCGKDLTREDYIVHPKTNLPECRACIGSEAEEKAVREAFDSLGEDFVCGCI